MGDLLTYRIPHFVLFSKRTFFHLFQQYHEDIWPVQFLFLSLGMVLLFLFVMDRLHVVLLSATFFFCWIWIAWFYHYTHYTTINWAAQYFAYAFFLQGAILLVSGLAARLRTVTAASRIEKLIAALLVAFSIAGYPLVQLLSGVAWTRLSLFGATADPTVFATLVFLAVSRNAFSWFAWIIPVLWSIISGAVLWTFDSPYALLLPVSAVVLAAYAAFTNANTAPASRHYPD
ncbi:MAG: DUF6064 family protein [Spirochaetota bacterium]